MSAFCFSGFRRQARGVLSGRATLSARRMKSLLFAGLLCCSLAQAFAQRDSAKVFSADSLTKTRWLSSWLVRAGDDLRWASPQYDDNGWTKSNTCRINLRTDTPVRFRGTAWFRKWIRIDSSLVNIPLALQMSHMGASQIFLNGDMLEEYGRLAPRDSVEYYNPQGEPHVFLFRDSGYHLLAVRYADWRSRAQKEQWGETDITFQLWLSRANQAVESTIDNLTGQMLIVVFLAVLFGTLALIHFVLWLYYRAARSNLPFALFSASLSSLCIVLLYMTVFKNSTRTIYAERASSFLMLLAVVSLSGFINSLFSRRKWRFRMVLLLGVLSALLILAPFETVVANYLPFILFVLVLLETVVLTIIAIFRRVPGARIIGAGVLLFSLLILTGVVVGFIVNGLHLQLNPNDSPILFWLTLASILAIPVSMSVYLAWNFAAVNKRLAAELQQVEALSEKARVQEEERQRLLETRQEELEREVSLRTNQLRSEKQKSDDLLLNILPEEVAEELKDKGRAQARLHEDVTVLFTDFVDFTRHSEKLTPAEIVDELDGCFKAFDEIITRHGLEKIKTIGDAYMAVAGLPIPHTDGAAAAVRASLDIRDYIAQRRIKNPGSFDIRIGVHSGPVVAGIIGVKKFAYDVWGDTVNTAARMEQSSEPGRVNISAATHALVGHRFVCTYRGEVAAKGKGTMGMWFATAVA